MVIVDEDEDQEPQENHLNDCNDFPRLGLQINKADIRDLHIRVMSLGPNPLIHLIQSKDNAILKKLLHYHDQLASTLSSLVQIGGPGVSNIILEEAAMEFLTPVDLFQATKHNRDAERLIDYHKEQILMLSGGSSTQQVDLNRSTHI